MNSVRLYTKLIALDDDLKNSLKSALHRAIASKENSSGNEAEIAGRKPIQPTTPRPVRPGIPQPSPSVNPSPSPTIDGLIEKPQGTIGQMRRTPANR